MRSHDRDRQGGGLSGPAGPIWLSIVVCTRGRPKQLQTCLDRFRGLAGRVAWELVVVNNGTGDGTSETTWAEPVSEEQYNRPRTRNE